jgi:hypothetical protein
MALFRSSDGVDSHGCKAIFLVLWFIFLIKGLVLLSVWHCIVCFSCFTSLSGIVPWICCFAASFPQNYLWEFKTLFSIITITSLLLSFYLYSPCRDLCVCVPPSRNNCTTFMCVHHILLVVSSNYAYYFYPLNFFARWYAKRFLHRGIVAPYDHIFMWDEDLGVEHFNAEEWVLDMK